jgi:hypothetical protein
MMKPLLQTRSPRGGTIPLWPGVVVAAIVGFVYLTVASDGTFHFRQSKYPHHVLIADAWLHGQLHVREAALDRINAPYYAARAEALYIQRGSLLTEEEWQRLRDTMMLPTLHDWSVVDGKYYGYWGPATAAVVLPYVAVAGIEASDRLVGAVIGALTILLMYLTLREASRLALLSMNAAAAAAVALLLGLGTIHFYLAVSGWVWFLSQVVAAFFLTLSIWSVLRIDRAWWWSVVGGVAFSASFLARGSELFAGLFFPVVMIGMAKQANRASWARTVRMGVAFGVPVVAAILVMLMFNYARFGNAFETGQSIQVATTGSPRFVADYRKYGTFSLHYVARNAYYYFANAALRRNPQSGAWTFDPDGNSMFLVTPALLLALLSYRRRNWLTVGGWMGCGVCLAMLLCYFATGWRTFGNRFLLDLLPLAMLLVAAGMNGRLTYASGTLILLSVAVNAWGTYRFSFWW